MGIGRTDIHSYIRELEVEDKNFNRVYEFLSSLIGKIISGEFRRGHGDWVVGNNSNYTFMITRYSLNEKSEILKFEDNKSFTYLVRWDVLYHIS